MALVSIPLLAGPSRAIGEFFVFGGSGPGGSATWNERGSQNASARGTVSGSFSLPRNTFTARTPIARLVADQIVKNIAVTFTATSNADGAIPAPTSWFFNTVSVLTYGATTQANFYCITGNGGACTAPGVNSSDTTNEYQMLLEFPGNLSAPSSIPTIINLASANFGNVNQLCINPNNGAFVGGNGCGEPKRFEVAFNNNSTLTVINPNIPVPGPFPILGVAAAFGYSRKLRQRIKSSKQKANSIIP